MEPTTANLAEAIERDGYAVVIDVVGPAVLDELIAALDRVEPDLAVLRKGGSVYAMRDLLRRVPEVRRLAESAPIRGLVEPVLRPGAFVVRGLLFDKTPEANWYVTWHRDLTIAVRHRIDVPGFGPWTTKAGIPHVQPPADVLRRMLTVRLHLDDSGERNGPLHIVPGSHLPSDLRDASRRGQGGAVACPVARGGALLMRPLILHSSPPSDCPARRRVIHLEFAAERLPEGLEWFEGAVGRG